MIRSASTGSAMAGRGGVWEAVGILAAVVPCGVLAGLYLATDETGFIVACVILATLAGGIVAFKRNPRSRLSRRRRGAEGGATGRAGSERLRTVGSALGRTFTRPVLKVLGFALWILAWGVTAALYARVVSNAQIGGLVMLVLIGGFSPVVIYFGLESGVKKLTGRARDRE